MSQSRTRAYVDCRDAQGYSVVRVAIWSIKIETNLGESSPLTVISKEEASSNSEEIVQLRERCRYVYKLENKSGRDLILQERPGIIRNPYVENEDSGYIEMGDYCGLFPLVIVEKNNPSVPIAQGAVEVRSIKLDYREHYRGMLSYIAEKCAGLIIDSGSPTKLRLDTLWSRDTSILEQQIEFLRHILESPSFHAALNEILQNPHVRLENELEKMSIQQHLKRSRELARQISIGINRREVPSSHPISINIKSLPENILVQTTSDFLDTAENRFIKMVLMEFHDFLINVLSHLKLNKGNLEDNKQYLFNEINHLIELLETQLVRGFLPDISQLTIVPIGSPILQKKAGYRELLHYWLQFHASAQLVWDGGSEVYTAGARNVATLYEYWLFFQLEDLFRKKFSCNQPLHQSIVEVEGGIPHLKLRRGIELKTPVTGFLSKTTGRKMRAEFHFNRKFAHVGDREKRGSWTRNVRPDYTFSIFPAEFSPEEAESNELMVHVHFDAKYRVERNVEIVGDIYRESTNQGSNNDSTLAKYEDLLKMHAYRDAIRRTAGAYVLYPGNEKEGQQFVEYQGYHEILPGLGAFAIKPDFNGDPIGIDAISRFFDDMIEELSNRTTLRERITYHIDQATKIKAEPIRYTIPLFETDPLSLKERAVPPIKHYVLIIKVRSKEEYNWIKENKLVLISLNKFEKSKTVQPELSFIRDVLLFPRRQTDHHTIELYHLRTRGYRIINYNILKKMKYPEYLKEEFLLSFDIENDPTWEGTSLKRESILTILNNSEKNHKKSQKIPNWKIITLNELLKSTN